MGSGKCGKQSHERRGILVSGAREPALRVVSLRVGTLTNLLTSFVVGWLLSGCLGSRPAGSDAPRCGDGIVQAPEVCDDGDALNGTVESYCTLVCGSDELLPLTDVRWLRLPTAPKWIEVTSTDPSYLVFTSFDDTGVQVVRNFNKKVQPQISATIAVTDTLFVKSAPSYVALAGDGILWIEKYTAATGGPRMYTVKLPANPLDVSPLVPRELAYPFPQGEGGQIVGNSLLFDRDRNPPYDMLSAQVLRRGSEYFYTLPLNHGPSPGRLQTFVFGDGVSTVGSYIRQLRFFAEPQSMVVHTLVPPLGIDAHVFSSSRLAPVAAIAGAFGRYPHHPREIALLDAQGAVTLHTFFCNEPTLEVEDLFTQLEPGTTSMRLQITRRGDMTMLLTINSSGELLLIGNNGKGKGLKPQKIFSGPPCSQCTTSNSYNGSYLFAFDSAVALGGTSSKFLDSPGVSRDYTVDPCLRD